MGAYVDAVQVVGRAQKAGADDEVVVDMHLPGDHVGLPLVVEPEKRLPIPAVKVSVVRSGWYGTNGRA